MPDKYDIKILDLLQQDGRISFIALGKRVGLTRQAVTVRVNKLKAEGYIRGFSVDLDHDRLGRPIIAYVDIMFQPPFTEELEKTAIEYVKKINGVRQVNSTVGEQYITLKLRARDIKHLDRVVRSIQYDLPGVTTRTILVNELYFSNRQIRYSED